MSTPNEPLPCYGCGQPILPGPYRSTSAGWGGLDFHEECAGTRALVKRLALDKPGRNGR